MIAFRPHIDTFSLHIAYNIATFDLFLPGTHKLLANCAMTRRLTFVYRDFHVHVHYIFRCNGFLVINKPFRSVCLRVGHVSLVISDRNLHQSSIFILSSFLSNILFPNRSRTKEILVKITTKGKLLCEEKNI